MDYSKLTDSELLALKKGDVSSNKYGNPISLTGLPMQGSAALAKLSPEAQRGVMTAAGAEIGLPAGPIASGTTAAAVGAMTEAAQNPKKAIGVMSPMVKTALAPTSENVLETMKQITQPGTGDFLKRRAAEFGTAAAGGALLKGAVRGAEVEGPISAGMNQPSLVFKSVRERILDELGLAKKAAMSDESISEGQRLMKMLRTEGGRGKLADEAIKTVGEQGGLKGASNTQLMAYDEALGKVKAKGGTFSHVYDSAQQQVRDALKAQAPTVSKYKALARKVYQAQGVGDAATSLLQAIKNPAGTAATMPGVQRLAGATLRGGAEALFPGFVGSADTLSNAIQNLANKRKNGKGY